MNLPDVFAAEIVGKLDVHEGLTHAAIRATLALAESHLAAGAPASALQHALALEHSAPALRLDGLRAAVGFFFHGAPEEVMRWTLGYVRGGYGSVDGYLDRIGVNADARRGLAKALCE